MNSARSRTFRCEGVVLRCADMGEADRLVVALTPDRGIVRAVAKGARKATSKTGGHLDLLRYVSLSVSEGRNLGNVGQADTVEGFLGLRQDLGKLSRGIYVAELAERFSVEDAPNEPVFRLLVDTLGALETTSGPDLLVRWYEVRLLQLSGFMPEVSRCAGCGNVLAEQDHVWSANRGGLVCPTCKSAGGETVLAASATTIKLLRHMARSDWPAVEGVRAPQEVLQQVERILRRQVRYVLDHNVRSVAFMDEVRNFKPSA